MFIEIFQEIIYIFNESAIFILVGFFIAGILKVLVPAENISRHLGKSNIGSVLLSSLLGIPLPLCSCAVLPTALSLNKQGASKGATISFLISTPETGVDSIAITYALMDPIMTIFRPLSALITAVTAGICANFFDSPRNSTADLLSLNAQSCDDGGCGCDHDGHSTKPRGKVGELFHYAYVELLNDIAFWLIIGICVAGIISAIVPDDFFLRYLDSGFLSMVIMLFVGIPIYMCASSSTPIAAALIMKGLNPGAALVFLLAGPATNVGTIAAIGKFLGKRMMVVYLGTIIFASMFLGYLLTAVYSTMDINPAMVAGQASEFMPEYLKSLGSLVLIALIARNIWNTGFRNIARSLKDKFHDFTGLRNK